MPLASQAQQLHRRLGGDAAFSHSCFVQFLTLNILHKKTLKNIKILLHCQSR